MGRNEVLQDLPMSGKRATSGAGNLSIAIVITLMLDSCAA